MGTAEVNPALRRTPLARALTTARLAADKRQADAARHIGVGKPMMANAESGHSLLSPDHLPKLALFYGCSAEALRHAHDLSLSVFKLKNPGDDELRAEAGLALQATWEKLGPDVLAQILALLPVAPPRSASRGPSVRKCR